MDHQRDLCVLGRAFNFHNLPKRDAKDFVERPFVQGTLALVAIATFVLFFIGV